MKVLVDECIDWRIKRFLGEPIEARSVHEMGWTGVKNGELLKLAEQEFDVLLTVDQKLPSQQNLAAYQIAVVVVQASDNRLATLTRGVELIESAIRNANKGEATYVRIPGE